ncbi:hypothetical protein RNJ44_02950 [Nakaseomyces bracarensis]|uniref:Uncharacterized protein n=1 Tax=Nakaseomyces bracarensis TaxID=273131 RepID=A0ABR4P0P6_9SACH
MSRVVFGLDEISIPNKRYRVFVQVVELCNGGEIGHGFVSSLVVKDIQVHGQQSTFYMGEKVYRSLTYKGVIGGLTAGQILDVMVFTVVTAKSFVLEILDMKELTSTEFRDLQQYIAMQKR